MLNRIQCPVCFNGSLKSNNLDYFLCGTCDEKYPIFDNVPYLGRFYEGDLHSVMETTSILTQIYLDKNQTTYANQSPEQLRRGYLRMQEMLELSTDDIGSNLNLSEFGYNQTPSWFCSRYNELQQFRDVVGNTNFNDKSILDIGAGTGYDSLRFLNKGGNVTALEYNPLQASYAAKAIQNINWIGGSATHIPFKNETFDFVIANAALHHIRDIETAINEMLRVLKTGGTIITLADSFSPDNFTEEQEVDVFKKHPAVLGGVNEQLPHLKKYINPLIAERNNLKVELFTNVVHGLHKKNNKLIKWSLDDAKTVLSNYRGGICMKINKLAATKYYRKNEDRVLIDFSDYIPHFSSRAHALIALNKYMPKVNIDLGLNNSNHQKFMLLMGWKPFSKIKGYRIGVFDGYLFCSKKYITEKFSQFFIAVPHAKKDSPRKLRIIINGNLIHQIDIYDSSWKKITLHTDSFSAHINTVSLVQISINKVNGGIDLNSFWIRQKPSILTSARKFLMDFLC